MLIDSSAAVAHDDFPPAGDRSTTASTDDDLGAPCRALSVGLLLSLVFWLLAAAAIVAFA